jgi:helicase
VLSTIAADYAHTVQGIHEFFGKTFYACQYPMGAIKTLIARILQFLYLEKMIDADGEDVLATRFGKRVSDLYIDPVSAVIIRDAVSPSNACLTDLSFLHLIVHTPDMGPSVRVFPKEQDDLCLFVDKHKSEFLVDIPDEWSRRLEYERFLCEVKTAKVLSAWIDEVSEDNILGKFSVQPGDLYRAIENAKWLLYATHEIATLFGNKRVLPKTLDLMLRVDKGVKTELLPLIRLSGIGRARGRILFNAGYKTVEDVKQAKTEALAKLPLIGPKLAARIIEQSHGRKEEPSGETVQKQRLLTDF